MSNAKNNGAASHLVELIRQAWPTGGVLLILLDEEPGPQNDLGIVTVDGAFRMGPVLSDRGAVMIRELGKRIGESARSLIKEVTERTGGTVLSDDSTIGGPPIGPPRGESS